VADDLGADFDQLLAQAGQRPRCAALVSVSVLMKLLADDQFSPALKGVSGHPGARFWRAVKARADAAHDPSRWTRKDFGSRPYV
jgi:hypothetical protein